MALSHITKVFAIKEAKIYKLLTDPAGAPPATYGTGVALSGAMKLTITGTVNTKTLRGDNTLLDADAVWDDLKGVIDHAKFNLDALAVLFSTAVVDSGTTPNQLATMQFKSTDTLNYWKLEARSASADPIAGDFHFQLPKCKIASIPTMGLMEEDYQKAQLNFQIMPTLADQKWILAEIRETFVALP